MVELTTTKMVHKFTQGNYVLEAKLTTKKNGMLKIEYAAKDLQGNELPFDDSLAHEVKNVHKFVFTQLAASGVVMNTKVRTYTGPNQIPVIAYYQSPQEISTGTALPADPSLDFSDRSEVLKNIAQGVLEKWGGFEKSHVEAVKSTRPAQPLNPTQTYAAIAPADIIQGILMGEFANQVGENRVKAVMTRIKEAVPELVTSKGLSM